MKFLLIICWLSNCVVYASECMDKEYTELKEAMRDANIQNQLNITYASQIKKFKVITYNLGMLSKFQVSVAHYADRTRVMAEKLTQLIKGQDPDIISLQEVWHKENIKALNIVADSLGYERIEKQQKMIYRHGMQILIKKELMDPDFETTSQFVKYLHNGQQVRAVYEKLSRTWRGNLFAIIKLKGFNGKILIANTHLTPMLADHEYRRKQITIMESQLRKIISEVDFVIQTGDFNVPSDFKVSNSKYIPSMLKARKEYFQFSNLMGFIDTSLREDCSDNYYTFDNINPLVPIGYVSKDSQRQRIDYIFVGTTLGIPSDQKNIIVNNSQVVFKENIVKVRSKICTKWMDPRKKHCFRWAHKEEFFPLSDHFAVASDLTLYL